MAPDLPAAVHTLDGAALLGELHTLICRYVILPSPEAVDAVTLWVAATHAVGAWRHATRLVIRSPEKRCGKSRLLDVIECACRKPMMTMNASTAALYRAMSTELPPTLLVDEADAIFGTSRAAEQHEGLRALINAGFQRGRPVIRYNANAQRNDVFDTFGMVALAGIGDFPRHHRRSVRGRLPAPAPSGRDGRTVPVPPRCTRTPRPRNTAG